MSLICVQSPSGINNTERIDMKVSYMRLFAAVIFSLMYTTAFPRTSKDCEKEIDNLKKEESALKNEEREIKRQPIVRYSEKHNSYGNIVKQLGNTIEINKQFECAYSRGTYHRHWWKKRYGEVWDVCRKCRTTFNEWEEYTRQVSKSKERLERLSAISERLANIKSEIAELNKERTALRKEEKELKNGAGNLSDEDTLLRERFGAIKVDYIECNGGFINTGVNSSSDLNWSVEFNVNANYTTNLGIFGARTGNRGEDDTLFWAVLANNTKPLRMWGKHYVACPVQTRVTASRNGNAFILSHGDTSSSIALPPASFSVTVPYYLGTMNIKGTSPASWNGIRYYKLQISKNGQIILDFVPVRIGTEGAMYDRVSQKIFRNAGSGDFKAGEDI